MNTLPHKLCMHILYVYHISWWVYMFFCLYLTLGNESWNFDRLRCYFLLPFQLAVFTFTSVQGPSYMLLPAATKLWPRLCFTRECDSVHSGGGGLRAGRTPPEQTPPQEQTHPPEQTPHPPGADTPPPREQTPPWEADSSIRSTSGRYASYWNAFLSWQFSP